MHDHNKTQEQLIAELQALRQRLVELEAAEAERQQVEEQLRQSEYELTVRNKIIKTFLTFSADRMYDEVLQIVLETLASPFGVFGYLDEQGNLVVPTMTRHVWEQCKIADKNIVFPQSAWGKSTWPRAIREKRTITVNHPSINIPSGHIPIQRHISMPLLHQNEVVGLLQVANKATEYHERDVALLQTLANVIAPVLAARIQRDRQEQARRQAEAEQERLTMELVQKNQELEQIVYVTSHDLRSPLVNVQGFSKELQYSLQKIMTLLQSDQVPEEIRTQIQLILEQEITEDLEYILTSIARMDILLAGLLRLSRLGRAALTMEALDMNVCLSNVISTFEFQIKEARVRVEIGHVPSCQGDAVQINQVFSNLVGNALKFLAPDRPGVIKINGDIRDNQSIYCVEDNGIGIASEHQEHIFEIFHRLDPTQNSGEGLGLTIVRRILERHHGSIRVESEPGRGSKFYVTLPRS